MAVSLNSTSLEPVYESPEAHLLHDVASVKRGRQCYVLEEKQHHCQERWARYGWAWRVLSVVCNSLTILHPPSFQGQKQSPDVPLFFLCCPNLWILQQISAPFPFISEWSSLGNTWGSLLPWWWPPWIIMAKLPNKYLNLGEEWLRWLHLENEVWCNAFLPVGPFPVTWSQLIVSIQTAVLLFPVNLVIGRLFLLIQPQEPLPIFSPSQASCPSEATLEPLSLTKVAEVCLMSNL